jgi:DNA-binding transcriptional LysR family regulator
MDTILGLIAGGLGVCLVPGRLVHPREGVVFRKLKGPGTPVPYQIAAVWRQNDTNPSVAAFVATLRATIRQPHAQRLQRRSARR